MTVQGCHIEVPDAGIPCREKKGQRLDSRRPNAPIRPKQPKPTFVTQSGVGAKQPVCTLFMLTGTIGTPRILADSHGQMLGEAYSEGNGCAGRIGEPAGWKNRAATQVSVAYAKEPQIGVHNTV